MGIALLEIGVQIRKAVIFLIRKCYRLVCNHPFLMVMVFFLILMYKLFPLVFSLLVSSSPVLVCTAVLLGTLLSFGQPNIPEIEKEEKTTHEIVSLKTGISRDSIVVERDENYLLGRYNEKRRDVVGKSIEEASWTANDATEVAEGDSFVDSELQSEGKSREIEFQKQVITAGEHGLHAPRFELNSGMNEVQPGDEEVVDDQCSAIQSLYAENLEFKNDKSAGKCIDFQRADCLNPAPSSPWKQVEDGEEEDDEASDGSNEAESSSPDASMADIIPMLDELHPLLDEDAPQPAHMSDEGSDAASERSLKSSDGGDESDENSDNQEELEIGDDENDDDEEEEETQGAKEDGTKSAITWTEDDQKNLIDLGTSELERNQRLESLIARRRARKNMRMMAEKNLIDLEGADLPFSIAPISTTRHNPFDHPCDVNENMLLPPIPGSAPSVLLPRRNPFDLPYDSSEEKPNLMSDSFHNEFMTFQPKEQFFRRHESFNVGSSFFGTSRQEKQDIKLRPFFVPERIASEGTSYAPFQRQSSELSDSKVSSVPETESIGSAGDLDDKNLIEEDFSPKVELISTIEHDSQHVGHGSQSSDVDSVELDHAEKRDLELHEIEIKLGDEENHHEMEATLSVKGGVANLVGQDTRGTHTTEVVEQRYSIGSSSILLPEVNETIFNEKEGDSKVNLIQEAILSKQPSLEKSDFSMISGLVGDTQHREPIYDSSPPAVKKNLSSSSTSISSDLQVEISKLGSLPVVVKRTISFDEKESEVSSPSIKKDTPGKEEMVADSSQIRALDEIELGCWGVTETGPDFLKFGISGATQQSGSANVLMMPKTVADYTATDSQESSETPVEEDLTHQDGSYQTTGGQVPLLSFDADIHGAAHQDVSKEMEFKSSEGQNSVPTKEEQNSLVIERYSPNNPNTVSFETELEEEHLMDMEAPHLFTQDQVHSSNSDAEYYVGVQPDEKLISTHYPSVSKEKSVLQPEKELPLPDESMDESSDYVEVVHEQVIILAESTEEVSYTNNLNITEVQELNDTVAPEICPSSTPEPTSTPCDDSETKALTALAGIKDDILGGNENDDRIQVLEHFQFPVDATDPPVDVHNIVEDADDVKEIDEGLLLELDAVGDFSLKDLGSNFGEIEKQMVSGGMSFPVQRDHDPNSSGPVEGETIEVDETECIVDRENRTISKIEHSSIGHVDSSMRKYDNKDVQNPLDLKSIKDEPQQNKSEVEAEAFLVKLHTNVEEVDTGMPVVEARSYEDIESIFKAQPLSMETEVELGELEIPHQGKMKEVTDFEMPILEAQSLEDINTAFKQINEKVDEKSVVVESLRTELISGENMAECSESGVLPKGLDWTETKLELPVLQARSMEDTHLAFKKLEEKTVQRHILHGSGGDGPDMSESKDPAETSSDLHVVETKSPKDVNVTFMEISESKLDKQPKSGSEDGLTEVEAKEVASSKIAESNSKESGVQETSSGAAKKSDHEVGTFEDLSSSISDLKVEENVHKST
ncbi:unnamed protein product [Ilex paraguariensis]|uniref:Uncharacterized protein n=1 Tax=Ilex paraguariensis TaxID=185542 RepID=A0ABC8TU89_9AQUA